jgi:DNA ligase-1
MRRFARLYTELDAQTATNAKVAALKRYFAEAPAADAAWAVYFLAGGKPRQTVPTRMLREVAMRTAGLPEWLFEESYQAVGDLAETIAHVLPEGDASDDLGLAGWIEQRLLPLRGMEPADIEARLADYWRALDWQGRFLLTKLIGGGFRVGVSRLLVIRALAEHAALDPKLVALRAMGYTDAKATPTPERFARLIECGSIGALDAGSPYPFFLAHQLTDVDALGDPADWQVEWKYDGIRAQLVRRAGQTWIWSRGEELVTERFPEIVAVAQALPDGSVLDGEILVWKGGERPAPFALLQQRIGRKTLGKKILADAPVAFMAYDLLEAAGRDIRTEPQHARRALLEVLLATHASPGLLLSPLVKAGHWPAYAELRTQSRARGVEGFMLKHRASAYGTGRTRDSGLWWKWKIDPLSVDCVLIYAQAGHGRRASLYTDYTFAVWNGSGADRTLVPFAKAYSGLTDEEFRAVDAVIRKTTIEKFGPVRSVTPSLVFELGFEGIQQSPRHKSGIAVRFPRMLRLRADKKVEEADTLERLKELLAVASGR